MGLVPTLSALEIVEHLIPFKALALRLIKRILNV